MFPFAVNIAGLMITAFSVIDGVWDTVSPRLPAMVD
jgi:hypothetical protein